MGKKKHFCAIFRHCRQYDYFTPDWHSRFLLRIFTCLTATSISLASSRIAKIIRRRFKAFEAPPRLYILPARRATRHYLRYSDMYGIAGSLIRREARRLK